EFALVHGIRTALETPGPEWRLVLACDMPAVDGAVVAALWGAATASGSSPWLEGAGDPEPVPSLWHRDGAARVRADWGLVARDWIRRAGLGAWRVAPERSGALVNVNTPAEWEQWRCRAGDAGSWTKPARRTPTRAGGRGWATAAASPRPSAPGPRPGPWRPPPPP